MLKALPVELAIRYKIMTVQKRTKSFISYSIVFGKLSQLQILMRRVHLTLINVIHNTNRLH